MDTFSAHAQPSQGWQRDACFGCGPSNPIGLRLQFTPDAASKSCRCEFTLEDCFVGPPGHAHGGIIATILDEAMGKCNKLLDKVALTRRMDVEYLRPVPLGQPLFVVGQFLSIQGRSIHNRAEICNQQGVVLAKSKGEFLCINPEKMFGRELEEERRKAAKP